MSRALLLALPVLVLACSSSPPPAASPPSQEQAAMQQQQQMQDDLARAQLQGQAMAAQNAAIVKAAEDEAMKPVLAMQKAEADRQAAAAARIESQKKACADTRDARLLNAKQMVTTRLKSEAVLLKNAKAIRASCKLVDKATGAVNVSRSGSGWRASPEMTFDDPKTWTKLIEWKPAAP